MSFVLRQKVMFQHCDPAGIVFYPRYFEMLNAVVEEWFEERMGFPFAAMHGPSNVAVPMRSISVDFLAPSRLGDLLDFRLRHAAPGRTSLSLEIDAACGDELRLACRGTIVQTDKADGRPKPWTEELRGRMIRESEHGAT